jgi:pimeloyl-ACP methyl ester carboxylesterase
MQRAPVDGIELEYEIRGTGEPVVLIHAGVCAEFFRPLADPLAVHHTVLRYHRTGYAGSDGIDGAVSFADQAAHCRAIMRHVGLERAHVVGHSSSASMALQLALDAPDAVQSLALLDAARPAVPNATQQRFVQTVAAPALERYTAGDNATAVDTWMRGVCGPGYREALERVLPGAIDQALADAGTFFGQELPAVMQWTFGPKEAGQIRQPALVVTGANSIATFHERGKLLLEWLPNASLFELPDATHLLQVENPTGLAEALMAFFSRHPLAARSAVG